MIRSPDTRGRGGAPSYVDVGGHVCGPPRTMGDPVGHGGENGLIHGLADQAAVVAQARWSGIAAQEVGEVAHAVGLYRAGDRLPDDVQVVGVDLEVLVAGDGQHRHPDPSQHRSRVELEQLPLPPRVDLASAHPVRGRGGRADPVDGLLLLPGQVDAQGLEQLSGACGQGVGDPAGLPGHGLFGMVVVQPGPQVGPAGGADAVLVVAQGGGALQRERVRQVAAEPEGEPTVVGVAVDLSGPGDQQRQSGYRPMRRFGEGPGQGRHAGGEADLCLGERGTMAASTRSPEDPCAAPSRQPAPPQVFDRVEPGGHHLERVDRQFCHRGPLRTVWRASGRRPDRPAVGVLMRRGGGAGPRPGRV